MTTLLYRHPRILLLFLGVIIALAASAGTKIGRQEDPTITNIFATIVTPYPGAAPSRVEALVTEPIEEELREIAEIDEITSVSRAGISVVSLELSDALSVDAIEQTWAEVRDALSDAARTFPAGVPEPEFDTDRGGSAYTTISAILMRGEAAPNPAIQRRYGELLQDRLRIIDDTKLVRLFGAQEEEIRVTVDAQRLASLGLTFDDVARALERADAKVRAGALQGDRQDTLIEIAGEIEDLSRIRDVPIGKNGDGTALRLGAVATIERAFADPPGELAYADGRPAVLVAARMENDRQVDAWTAAAREVFVSFEAQLPDGLEHRLLFDQSRYVAERFATLGTNLAIGVGLVVAVLFVSLGWRAASVVAAVIPLATLASITVMQAIGLPVQQMSVTGLIVALGLLVDAAIVMCDEIRRRLSDGLPKTEAIAGSVKRLAAPLLASTVTTVLAFLPMALLPGPAGDFVGSIALAVMIMLAVSLALALTVTPAIAGWLLSVRGGRGFTVPLLAPLFDRSIGLALKYPHLSILGAMVLPIMGFVSLPTLTSQFFPGVDRDQVYVQVTLPSGSAIRATDALVQQLDAYVRAREEVAFLAWTVGGSAPAFYYNMVADKDGIAGYAEGLVTTRSPEATERLIPSLQADLNAAFPAAEILVRGLVQGPPVDAPVEFRLVGPSLERLRVLGDELRLRLTEVPGVTHARADLVGGAPKLVVRLDEEKVHLAGLTLGEVARQFEAAVSGASGGSLIEASEELPLRSRLAPGQRETLAAVRALEVIPPAGRSLSASEYPAIPLSALGEIELVPSQSPIARRYGERVNTVQAFLDRNVLPEEALAVVQAGLDAEPLDLPPGYRLEVGGDADARAETAANLAASAGLVVTLTMVTIVLTFGSYRLSLITVLVGGLSFGLSILALAIFQYPFGIQALIGAIGSIGVSINAAIIILTGMQGDAAAMAGDREAMRRVVVGSTRHIVSTTITTVGGFVPLIVGGGGFWPPFAMAIAGGVLLSSVVSFYFTAPMFALIHRRRPATQPLPTAAAAEPTNVPASR